MANKYVVMVEIGVELTKDEIGKAVTLTGVTGNPAGTLIGLQTLAQSDADPKSVTLTMISESGTLVL